MNEELSYPYRRFSSDLYASSLLSLLDEHAIPFEIVGEPEGAGSVFIGAAGIPGVIVMVRPSDAKRIQELERKERPGLKDDEEAPQLIAEEKKEFDTIHPLWIAGAYIFSLLGAPLAMIFGWHLFSAKRKKEDLTFGYAYEPNVRTHGRFIFWIAFGLVLLGFYRWFALHSRSGILEPISFVLSRFRIR